MAKQEEGPFADAFAKSSLEAVKQWRFLPAMKDGKPVAVVYDITVRFDLRNRVKSRARPKARPHSAQFVLTVSHALQDEPVTHQV